MFYWRTKIHVSEKNSKLCVFFICLLLVKSKQYSYILEYLKMNRQIKDLKISEINKLQWQSQKQKSLLFLTFTLISMISYITITCEVGTCVNRNACSQTITWSPVTSWGWNSIQVYICDTRIMLMVYVLFLNDNTLVSNNIHSVIIS